MTDYKTYLDNGILELRTGDLNVALDNITKSIELKNDWEISYFYRAVVHQSMNHYDEAILDYTKALQINDKMVDAYYNRAQIILTRKDIINADINRETLSIAAMLYIMNGYKHIEMNCVDVLSNPDIAWEADKIFVDAPIGPRTVNLRYGSGLIDCGILSVYKALECLREDGVAVVALPSSALFGTAKTHIALKRELVDKGYLQAVIALPITWFGTGVTINLLILSKQQTNNKVLFINAHNASFAKYVQKSNGKMSSITKEGLDEILDIFYNNTEVEGLSSSISLQTIVNKDYDLMPTTYIKERLAEEDMTIEEIDAELEKLYAQIGVNIRG